MRRVVFFLLAPILTAVGTAIAFLVLPFTPRSGRAPHRIAREWARAILRISGVRLSVEAASRFAPDEPRVFVANHASYLDIPAAILAFPGELRIVARKSLGRIPFLGWYMKACGHLLIDRDDPRQGLATFATASRRMKAHGLSVLVFPEGTRTADGRLGPLKGGAFHLATSLDVPVQPLSISGTFAVMPRTAMGPLRGGPVVVRVGPAIQTAGRVGGPARKALAAEVRAALLGLGLEDGAAGASAAPHEAS